MELKAKYENEMRIKEELDKKDDTKRQKFMSKGVHVMDAIPGSESNSFSSS